MDTGFFDLQGRWFWIHFIGSSEGPMGLSTVAHIGGQLDNTSLDQLSPLPHFTSTVLHFCFLGLVPK